MRRRVSYLQVRVSLAFVRTVFTVLYTAGKTIPDENL